MPFLEYEKTGIKIFVNSFALCPLFYILHELIFELIPPFQHPYAER